MEFPWRWRHKYRNSQRCSHTASCGCLWPCKEGSALQPQLVFTRGQKDGALWACWDCSASQRCRAAEHTAVPRAARMPAGPLSSISQLLQTPFQVPPPQQELSFHRGVHCQPSVSSEAHPVSTASVPARATAGGISSLHFHFCSLFHPQMRTPTLTQTEEPNTNQA